MKKAMQMFFALLLAFAAVNIGRTGAALSSLEHSVIRLHILANSDSTADQTEKLLVRDALLAQAADWIPAQADMAAGCAALEAHLPEIRQTAEQTLREAGCGDAVAVTLEKTAFPARTYGDLTLPAGEYEALRVEIGEAAGQNWWCVMYPALCVPAADADPAESLDDAAYALAAHPEEYEIRLKCVELFRAVSRWVQNGQCPPPVGRADSRFPPEMTVEPHPSYPTHAAGRAGSARIHIPSEMTVEPHPR